jgi:hypothetical protein
MLVAKREEDATARFSLRLPENLRAQLEAKARLRGISLNAEMVLLLNDALHQEQIERIVFGRHYGTLIMIAQVINGLEKVEGKKLEEDFRNIMRTAADVVIRFMENAPAAFASSEYPVGIRDRIDTMIVQMLTPIGKLLPLLPCENDPNPPFIEALRAEIAAKVEAKLAALDLDATQRAGELTWSQYGLPPEVVARIRREVREKVEAEIRETGEQERIAAELFYKELRLRREATEHIAAELLYEELRLRREAQQWDQSPPAEQENPANKKDADN